MCCWLLCRYLSLYLGLGLAYGVAVFLRSYTMNFGCWRASRSIFSRMLRVLMRARMSFFESTPVGR